MAESDSATEILGHGNYADRADADKQRENRRGYDSSIGALQNQVAELSDQVIALGNTMRSINDFVEFWKETQGAFRLTRRIFMPFVVVAAFLASIAVVFSAVWAYFHALEVRITK